MVHRIFLSVLGVLLITACGKSGNGGGFGKPPQPVLNPTEGNYDFVSDELRPSLTITSQNDVRYTLSLSGAPEDPVCDVITTANKEYTGPFQIGGPNETIRIKAIACDEGSSSVVTSSGEYVFGP